MEKLSAAGIRKKFLDYFAEKDHLIIPGAPLVPVNDPTLLFINSGMAPLKKYFLGIEAPPCKRLANFQPCVRTRDIDDVGDRHHMTMFEMLGSWSIGDYYKQRAVELAWELLHKRLGFPSEKLYVTVYAGNPKLNLPPDEESAKAWESVGVPRERIVYLGEDNFWGPAGDTGPCGPCTEVFIDTGDAFGKRYVPGEEFDSKSRYIEIWNAGVFMELNKNADGTYIPLPLKSVDTGSGLERMELAMQGFTSVYETSGLKPILEACKKKFQGAKFTDREYRILVDHLRAASFIVSEGVKPSNEGQGYIPRRLIRKCVAIGLRADQPSSDFSNIIDLIVQLNKEAYPHLAKEHRRIIEIIQNEANDFEPVIKRGLKLIEKEIETSKEPNLKASVLFDVVATHGLPFDIVRDFAASKGRGVDEAGYHRLFDEHKNVSRNESKKSGEGSTARASAEELALLLKDFKPTNFEGYNLTSSTGTVLAIISDKALVKTASSDSEVHVVLDKSCFYAESGGQVGDSGELEASGVKAKVLDTTKQNGVFLHRLKVIQGEIKTSMSVTLKVDANRRKKVEANHSATHLMHAALRQVLGPQATQKGSHVDDTRLRFDFQHSSTVTPDQIREIERRVNQQICENNPASTRIMDVGSAISEGAIAMFGEKYDKDVRVVRLAEQAVELCGGTHVHATGDIGTFLVLSESSVAKGIRRIEAVTGEAAVAQFQERTKILQQLASLMSTNPANLLAEITKLKSNKKDIKAAPAAASTPLSIVGEKKHLLPQGLKLCTARANGSWDLLRAEAENRVAKGEWDLCLLMGEFGGNANLVVAVNPQKTTSISANDIVKKLLPMFEGQGGGKPTFAQGVGKKTDVIDSVLEQAPQNIAALIRS